MFDLVPFGRSERDLWNMFDHFDRAFFGGHDHAIAPFRTDILDQGDRYVLEAELPGFAKEDIHIDLEGDMLTIRAEHCEEKETREKDRNFVRRERHVGSYCRSFPVGDVKCDGIAASYQDGVLRLEMPKRTADKPASRSIDIQ